MIEVRGRNSIKQRRLETCAGQHEDGERGPPLPFRERYGCVWTTLGMPERDIFDIREADEPDHVEDVHGYEETKLAALLTPNQACVLGVLFRP